MLLTAHSLISLIETQQKLWVLSTTEFVYHFISLNKWLVPTQSSCEIRKWFPQTAWATNHIAFQSCPTNTHVRLLAMSRPVQVQPVSAPAGAAGFLCLLENSRRSGGCWDTPGLHLRRIDLDTRTVLLELKSSKPQVLHVKKALDDIVRPHRSMLLKIFMVSYFTLHLSKWMPCFRLNRNPSFRSLSVVLDSFSNSQHIQTWTKPLVLKNPY